MTGVDPGDARHGADPLGPDSSIEDIEERVAYLSGQAPAGQGEPGAAPVSEPAAKPDASRRGRRGGCLSVVAGAVAGYVVASGVLPPLTVQVFRMLPAGWLSCQNLDTATLTGAIVMTAEAVVLAAAGVVIAAHGWSSPTGALKGPLLTDARLGWVVGALVAGLSGGWVLVMLACAL